MGRLVFKALKNKVKQDLDPQINKVIKPYTT